MAFLNAAGIVSTSLPSYHQKIQTEVAYNIHYQRHMTVSTLIYQHYIFLLKPWTLEQTTKILNKTSNALDQPIYSLTTNKSQHANTHIHSRSTRIIICRESAAGGYWTGGSLSCSLGDRTQCRRGGQHELPFESCTKSARQSALSVVHRTIERKPPWRRQCTALLVERLRARRNARHYNYYYIYRERANLYYSP